MLDEKEIAKIERRVMANFTAFNQQVTSTLGGFIKADGNIDLNGLSTGFERVAFNFATGLVNTMIQGSQVAAESAKDQGLLGTFDVTDVRTSQEFSNFKNRVVRGLVAQQQEALLEFRTKLATNPTARTVAEVREGLTLTARQVRAVDNYRTALESNSKQALNRQLRDKRSDTSILNAIKNGKALPQDRIDSLVDRYQKRQLDYRARTISRSEGVRIANQSDNLFYQQALDSGEITADQITRSWITSEDEVVRDSHASSDLKKQRVGQNEPFITGAGNALMYPGDPSAPLEEIVNCRCFINTEIKAQQKPEVA